LAIHELATNASKYGALSVPDGRVDVDWAFGPTDGPGKTLQINWRESGGPVVQAPAAKGFGRVVIEDMMKRSLRAQVTIEYAPQGLVWCARIPAEPFATIEPAHRPRRSATDVQ
jgi:two-component system CheB/CheR fusion protein